MENNTEPNVENPQTDQPQADTATGSENPEAQPAGESTPAEQTPA